MVKTPSVIPRIYSKRTWSFPEPTDTVYLTFDDGPIPEVTPWVLDTLNECNAKGTFFCIGDNIEKHPGIFTRIISEGHAIGNHTFHHLNGKHTKTIDYLENVAQCEATIATLNAQNSTKLFRPPYGRLTASQARKVRKKGYYIIMWDILSFDFDNGITEEQCLQNVLDHLQPGSIVVFHDSLKAEKRLRYALPKVLQFISEKNWKCESIVLP